MSMPHHAPFDLYKVNDSDTQEFEKVLKGSHIKSDFYDAPIFPGCVRIASEYLELGAKTAVAFHRACKAFHDWSRKESNVRAESLRAIACCPTLSSEADSLPFFMKFFRIDFYIDTPAKKIRIIEANTSPGAFPEHSVIDKFWGERIDTTPPRGFGKASPVDTLKLFLEYAKSIGKNVRTLGLIASDDKHYAPLAEARLYAEMLKRETDVIPVFTCIEEGTTLTLWDGETQPVKDIGDIDALYHNPGGTLEQREEFTKWLAEKDIFLLPPRSNILFTNKSFLPLLRKTLDRIPGLSDEDRELLRDAILPSFPLSEYEQHLDEIRSWKGVVVKRDFGSSGKQVYIFPFLKHTPDQAIAEMKKLQDESATNHFTWTVQSFTEPPSIDYDGKKLLFDLMVYTTFTPQPNVLFSCRPFTQSKANIADGAWYGHVARLPV